MLFFVINNYYNHIVKLSIGTFFSLLHGFKVNVHKSISKPKK